MATIVAAAGGGNWTVGGTWVGGVAPTSADDAQLTSTSGNVTINAGAVCRSLDCTGYVGTLTHSAGVTFNIGDATAGAANNALKLASGMTYTLGSTTTSAITFISTSATVQTITTAGKTLGNITWNPASNGSWQLADNFTATAATLTLTAGTLDLNSKTVTATIFNSNNGNTRTLSMGAAAITLSSTSTAWNVATTTGLTVTANTAGLTLTGSTGGFSSGAVDWNGLSVSMTGSGGQPIIAASSFTLANLSRIGTVATSNGLSISGAVTVTGTLTMTGNTAPNRLQVVSAVFSVPATITCTGTVSAAHVDFMDIIAAGSASWDLSAIAGGSGDCQGNTGIVFTPKSDRYAVAAGNVSSTAIWATASGGTPGASLPRPQDDVYFDANSGAGPYAMDYGARFCRNLDFSGYTGSFGNNVTFSIFGNLTLGAGMTTTGNQSIGLLGRGAQTIRSNGVTFSNLNTNKNFNFITTGSYTLLDDLRTGLLFRLTQGTVNCNGFNVTCAALLDNSTVVRALDMGKGTWTFTAPGGTILTMTNNAQLTFNGSQANMVIATATASTYNFIGGGLTYGTLNYTLAGSTGGLNITGANTFNTINFSDSSNARTLTLPAATVTTINNFNINGTSGKLMTINSSVSGSAATLSKPSGVVSVDYTSIKDSAASGGAVFYAGAHSTSISGNSGWVFTSPPPMHSSADIIA